METALNRAYDDLHAAGDPRTPTQQRADALVEICRIYLVCKPRRANLPSVLLITDEGTVTGEAVGECRLASGARLSPETARRIMCDSTVQEVRVGEDGVPLTLGRATRTFTPDQFRAMVVRDAHCRGPGCRVDPAHCEAHHLDEWTRDRGSTDLGRGALLCVGNCHRMLHEGGWTVIGDPSGELRFYDRAGGLIGTSVPYQRPQPLPTRLGRERADLDRRARRRTRVLRVA